VTAAERKALMAAGRLDVPSFPCLPDKKPACPNGFKAATLPMHGLATLWATHPGELVGVPTGPASALAVLDVDIAKGGDVWWGTNRDRLPSTRMHETRSGGLHVLFNHRPGLKCSVAKIGPGIDVRAEGGYIVWWPASGFTVVDHPIADWPEWLTPSEPAPPAPPRRPAIYDESGLTRKPRRKPCVACAARSCASSAPRKASGTPSAFGRPAERPRSCATGRCRHSSTRLGSSTSSRWRRIGRACQRVRRTLRSHLGCGELKWTTCRLKLS
jgi:hypothetical protein